MKESAMSLKALMNRDGVGQDGSFFTHIKEDTNLSEDPLQNRAQKVFFHVLHHYSDLSISTIDKFVYRIVRTFAHDLSLSQNFEVELDSRKIIQPVVGLLMLKLEQILNFRKH